MWDHSYEHEAWHEGDDTRVVLIVDVWHPDLTDAEVRFLGTLQNCRLRAGRILAEQAAQDLFGDVLHKVLSRKGAMSFLWRRSSHHVIVHVELVDKVPGSRAITQVVDILDKGRLVGEAQTRSRFPRPSASECQTERSRATDCGSCCV